jgi:hypothetical protein
MVRAGVVDHPAKWVNSGYHEIQQPRKRYAVIDLYGLTCAAFQNWQIFNKFIAMDRGSS